MDDVMKQKKTYGCRKCGTADIALGALYGMDGDFSCRLCDACRELYALAAPTLEWHRAWLHATCTYDATVERLYRSTDLSIASTADELVAAWLDRAEAAIVARRHMMAWLDAEAEAESGAEAKSTA